MIFYRALIIALCFIVAQDALAKVYKWTDESGRTHLSSRPPAQKRTAIETDKKQGSSGKSIKRVPEPLSVQPVRLGTNPDGQAYQGSIKLKLRTLLQQKKFNELNRVLDGYHTSSELNILAEENLFTAYDAFRINDMAYEALLHAWVKAPPDSYQPYLARATYYYSLGWKSRGGKWASETKKENFNKMNSYFNKAIKDIDKALSINKQSMVPYNLLIGITNAQGKDDEKAMILRTALDINPASFRVRSHYLKTLTPRWGGSFEEMQEFIEGSLVHVVDNPKLELLKGYMYAEAGDLKASSKTYSKAEKMYTAALTFGENHETLMDRGKNSYRRENYKDALKDLNRAIELYPENGKYYYWRSKTYSKLLQDDKASTDIELANQLEAGDEYIQSQLEWLASKFTKQGYELDKNRKSSEAIKEFNAALRLRPNDADTYYWRARAFINLNQRNSAFNDLKKAIKLGPNEYKYYNLLDWVLAKQRDWNQIITYWDQYITLNPDNSRAYVERGGAYFRKGDIKSAVRNAKIAADMGNPEGKEAYEKFRHMAR